MPLDLDTLLPPDDPTTANARLARLSFAFQVVGGLSDLAHDLCSPLHSLAMAVSLLEQDAADTEVCSMAKRLTGGATQRVEKLLGSLDCPDFDRRDPEPLVLSDLVARTLPLWPLQPLTKHRPLAVNLPISLPAVRASDASLRTALLQLLLNACEAQPGDETPPVELTATVVDGEVEITVRDYGPGFAGLSIAEAFVHGASTRDRDTHLGVGLGLARDLLAEIDASLEVEPVADGPGVMARVRLLALG